MVSLVHEGFEYADYGSLVDHVTYTLGPKNVEVGSNEDKMRYLSENKVYHLKGKKQRTDEGASSEVREKIIYFEYFVCLFLPR